MSLDVNPHQQEFTLCASLPAFPISAPDADNDCLLREYVENSAPETCPKKALMASAEAASNAKEPSAIPRIPKRLTFQMMRML